MLKIIKYMLLSYIFISCESLRKNGFNHKPECPTYNNSDQVKYDKKYYKCKEHSKIKIHEPK